MNPSIIALFGEAQRGDLHTAYFCQSLEKLFELLGEPPEDTVGLFFAVQALLYGKSLIYFRVEEEGTSMEDYHLGLRLLRNCSSKLLRFQALFLPGVGSKELIDKSLDICHAQNSLLIMSEKDFYDYLTEFER